jgi:hypothetical protein
MGSKNSSSGKKQNNEIKIIKGVLDKKSEKKTDLLSYMQYNTSSYHGIKSEASSDIMMKDTKESNKSNTNSEETTEKKIEPEENHDKKIKTTFFWREGGNTVYITGNFSNWNQWFLMNKEENYFSLVLVN